jgi:hypothetical protein
MRGKEDIDVKLLDHFVDTTRSLRGEIAYSNALLTASSACRICALDADALRFAQAAFDHANAHNLKARLPVIKLQEIRLHLATGNLVEARIVLSNERQFPIADDDTHSRFEWDLYDARVSVDEGDLTRAKTLLLRIGPIPKSFSANRRGACLAISLRYHLASGEPDETIRPLVQDLEETHKGNRDVGNQDYEAHALFLGLSRIGQQTRAVQILNDYIKLFRTVRRPLPPTIQPLLLNNGLDQHASRGRKKRAES